jgi:hypothetical protein
MKEINEQIENNLERRRLGSEKLKNVVSKMIEYIQELYEKMNRE